MARRSADCVTQSVSLPTHLRRSQRLLELHKALPQRQPHRHEQLPSPSPSPFTSRVKRSAGKRRRSELQSPEGESEVRKRARRANDSGQAPTRLPYDPVAYWIQTSTWPGQMMQRSDGVSLPNSKRKSSSTHHSGKEQRLEQNGIYMKSSTLLQRESKRFCDQLLEGDHEPIGYPCYPVDKIDDVLDRVHGLNEARLQRDVTPWVVPSAENLFFSGVPGLDGIGEEINAEWVRCEPMGLSRPKPDFTVGLRRSAFRNEELEKLENYGTPQNPFYFTPDLSFPFLICEAKTGRIGIDQADTQNIHSASIATKAIVSLYVAAFGREHEKTKDLLGRVLVFTVSHNNRMVNLYGHYAVAGMNSSDDDGDETVDFYQYFRYDIAMFSLSMYDGRERFRAYNFVRNLYDRFAPQHLERIREAVGSVQRPVPRTGLSFAASDIGLDEGSSQQGSEAIASQENAVFKTPSEPASASQKRDMANMKGQLDKLLRQLQELGQHSRDKEERMERLMDHQKMESKEQLEQQRKESKEQLEQQRKESKEQLEQQRKESKEQLEQLTGVISRFQESKDIS